MRTIVNHEELKKEWVVEKWYEKVYYVVGIINVWFYVGAFCVGLIQGLIEL